MLAQLQYSHSLWSHKRLLKHFNFNFNFFLFTYFADRSATVIFWHIDHMFFLVIFFS